MNQETNNTLNDTEKITHKYKGMAYMKGMSENIEKVFKEHCPDTKIAYRSTKCMNRQFSRLKEKIPKLKNTNVIYKIPCKGNMESKSQCDFSYVGQTKQYLEKRLKNHEYDLRKQLNSNTPKTALMDHFHNDNHYPDFKNTKIIDTQQHFGKRLTLESLHIYTEKTINIKEDTDNIAASYCVLLDNYIATKKRKHIEKNTYIEEKSNGPPYKKRRLN